MYLKPLICHFPVFTFVSHTHQYFLDSTSGLRILFFIETAPCCVPLDWSRIQYMYQAIFEHLVSLLPLPPEYSESGGIGPGLA